MSNISPFASTSSEHLSEALRFHRKRTSLTQAELAKLAGVGKTVIFDLESGKRSVQMDTLIKVLNVLNIEMRFFSPLMELYLKEVEAK